MPTFKLKIRTSMKRDSGSFVKDVSRRTLFDSTGDGASKFSIATTKNHKGGAQEEKSTEVKYKNYPDLEWCLSYVEEDGVLILICAKFDGKGKLELGKTFNYGHVTNIEYDDIDSSSIIIDVSSSVGSRRVRLDKGNLVADCCNPKSLRKDIQTKNNLLVALRPYVTREMMSGEAQTPPKKSRKSNPVHKKYNK